jgi:hypothetical protein
MTPEMAIAITGKNLTKPAFDAVVSDAGRAAGAVSATGGRMSAAMGDASFQTANLTAQFNDIGVMLASGQSPLVLAIQQGTQISQVFAGMKPADALNALKTAALSLLNPLSLVTIGSIAAGAAVVQWLMSTQDIETATEAFERHRKEIEGIVTGYADAQTAVGAYFETIGRMPRSVAAGEINAAFDSLGASVDEFRSRMKEFAEDGHWAQYGSQAVLSMQELAGAFARGDLTAEQFHQALEGVRDELNPIERLMAGVVGSTHKMIDGLQEGALASNQFANSMANLVAQSHALAGLSGNADLSDFMTSHAGGVEEALETLRDATPELRSIQQIIQDTYAAGMADPLASASGKDALTLARDEALAAIATTEARRAAASAAEDQADAYSGVIANLDHELMLIGLSEREQQALNNIRAAGVDAASEQGLAIRAMTEELYDQQIAMREADESQKALDKSWGDFGSKAGAVLRGLTTGTLDWSDALMSLARIGLQSLDLGGEQDNSFLKNLLGGLVGSGMPSFDGGGYTGSGPRSGGLDGKGGFLALMHPNEMVYGMGSIGENGPELLVISSNLSS